MIQRLNMPKRFLKEQRISTKGVHQQQLEKDSIININLGEETNKAEKYKIAQRNVKKNDKRKSIESKKSSQP